MIHVSESIQRSLCLMVSRFGIILAPLPEKNDLILRFALTVHGFSNLSCSLSGDSGAVLGWIQHWQSCFGPASESIE